MSMPFGSGVGGGVGQRDGRQQVDQLGRDGSGQHRRWPRRCHNRRRGGWPVVVMVGSVGVRRGRKVRRPTRAQRGHGAVPRGHPALTQYPETQTERLPALVQRGMTQVFIAGIENGLARGVPAGDRGRLLGTRL